MAEVSKKISFGFAKSKAGAVKKINKGPLEVEYISGFDRNAMILKSTDTKELVSNDPEQHASDGTRVSLKEKPAPVVSSAARAASDQHTKIPQTLEERAANELLRDAKQFSEREQSDVSQSLVFQIAQARNRVDSEVSTREDYEQVPVENFGLALLRGMGWDSTRGIGKKPQVVSAVKQVLRPKGVGLGAEKKNSSNNIPTSNFKEEELKAKVGAYLKITSGTHRGKYGKILGFNEESGRLIVELSCGGTNVSVNESAVELITKENYKKNSRVLNAAKYESYMRGNEIEHSDAGKKSQKRKHESR